MRAVHSIYDRRPLPVTYTAENVRRQARLTWNGTSLVIDRTNDDGVQMRIESMLSTDGKKLTREFSVDSPQGSTTWTYVYNRTQ